LSVYIPNELRRRVRAHFLQRCAYCQSSEALTVVTFEVEHIQPLSLGGQTDFENLCLACPTCNRFKANRVNGLTNERAESRLFHPERDYRHLLAQESTTGSQWSDQPRESSLDHP